jgi:hypothetical protein
MPIPYQGPRYVDGYEQDLVGGRARLRDAPPSQPYGTVVDETVDKVKILWPLGGTDWVHKRDITFLG